MTNTAEWAYTTNTMGLNHFWGRIFFKKEFFFLIHLFAIYVLVMKKLEIEKTKTTFIISVLKLEY